MNHPSHPDFWNVRYAAGQTPWDFGGVPSDLQKFLKKKSPRGKVLIPGAGSGYEIKAFADAGYDVTALDFSPAAVERAQHLVGPALADRVQLGDFFSHSFPATFDLIYERTFLCSIMPDRRPAYRDRMASLLKYGGQFVGYFFYQRTIQRDGPPFGLAWGEGDALFARHFLIVKDDPVSDSLPVFAGHERWQERRRTSYVGPVHHG
jgi:SAM-dependent methyltransferase